MPQNPSCYLQIHFLIVAFHRLFKIFYSVLHFFCYKIQENTHQNFPEPIGDVFLFFILSDKQPKRQRYSVFQDAQTANPLIL